MATPTPSNLKRPLGGALTPSQPNHSSPAPRSVPSPMAPRQPAGKTPATQLSHGSSGSKTAGGTPIAQSNSQMGNAPSPTAGMLSFGTPQGLGIDAGTPGGSQIFTPGGMQMPTPRTGSSSRMPSMNDLGLTTNGVKRNEDEERRTRMRKVLNRIGKPTGRVSEQGIARVSRSLGFDNDIDNEELTAEEKERKVGNRPILIGGKALVIEVDLKNQVPRAVDISFSGQNQAFEAAVKEQGQKAGKVLLDDLKADSGIALNAKLDRFAANLERLANMDRLSVDGINCFEALSGIYTSLRRLYDQEKMVAEKLIDCRNVQMKETARIMVTRAKSGEPKMHTRGRIGLEIEYWCQHEQLHRRTRAENSEMDGGGEQHKDQSSSATELNERDVHVLRIEPQPSQAGVDPNFRVSDAWLPDPLELSEPGSEAGIPWQDPPPSFALQEESNGENGQTPIGLRFVAVLDPPVVMPYQTATNILTAVGGTPPQMLTMPPSYVQMLLSRPAQQSVPSINAQPPTTSSQTVLSINGVEQTVHHLYTLEPGKPAYQDYAYRLAEIPFAHPRQLIELLPILRQWAHTGILLRSIFAAGDTTVLPHPRATDAPNDSSHHYLDLDNLLTPPPTSPPIAANDDNDNDAIRITTTFTPSPTPTLSLSFPIANESEGEGEGVGGGESLCTITVQISTNGNIIVLNHSNLMSGSNDEKEEAAAVAEKQEQESRTRRKMERALEVCGDVGVWVEWLRQTARQGKKVK